MTPEQEDLLKKSVALAEENNDMLRSLQRSARLARAMTIIYWLFIIGSAVGAYYLIQPYIDTLTQAYGGATSSFGNVSGLLDTFKQYTQ